MAAVLAAAAIFHVREDRTVAATILGVLAVLAAFGTFALWKWVELPFP